MNHKENLLKFNNVKITSVVATDINDLIGCDGILPFNQKEDMRRFAQITSGGIVIVGRDTFETFGKKPLRNRRHFILTSNENYINEIAPEHHLHCKVFTSVNDVMLELQEMSLENDLDVFVIGGSRVYSEMLPYVDTIKVTRVLTEINPKEKANYFHKIDTTQFNLAENEFFPKDKKGNDINVMFQTFVRK